MGAVAPEHVGVAFGVNTAVARVAGLLTVATLGIVFFVAFRRALPGVPEEAARAEMNALMAGRTTMAAGAGQALGEGVPGGDGRGERVRGGCGDGFGGGLAEGTGEGAPASVKPGPHRSR